MPSPESDLPADESPTRMFHDGSAPNVGPHDPTYVPSATSDGASPTEPIRTTTAGRYQILRHHAQGGLGEVYLARDQELQREVALKRLKSNRSENPQLRQRFIAEAAVTARLEHPGIVPVHGLVRDDSGQPCYAMRFIQGQTLAEAIEAFHKTSQFESLEFRQLLTRFVAACNAVGFAHSRGVVHRDLKPANVMLGPYGETLVVDWGLAKSVGTSPATPVSDQWSDSSSLDSDSVTQVGDVIGTPSYMSPEQARAEEVSPAADVYGLGAILYAMLTGIPPGRGRTPLIVLDQVRRGDIAPPRTLKANVPRGLDAICRKAMALRPEDRYPTALALAADIERWLADEPVSAEPEAWTARLRRWTRRHRVWVAAAGLLLVLTVLGLGLATMLIARQQAKTVAAKQLAEEQRLRADENLRLARRAVDTAARKVSGHPGLRSGNFHDLRADLLSALLPFYEELARQAADDPTAIADRALAAGWLGSIRAELGQTDAAIQAFQQMISSYSTLAQEYPDNREYRGMLARGYNDLGNLYLESGKTREAQIELLESVRLRFEMLAEDPSDPGYRHGLIAGLNGLAISMRESGRTSEAEARFRQALKLARQLAADRPDDSAAAIQCAVVENNLAALIRADGLSTEAEGLYRSAIERRTKVAGADANNPQNRQDLGSVQFNLGNLLMAKGRFEDAEKEYRLSIANSEKLVSEFSSVPAYRAELAKKLTNLGVLRARSGNSQDAIALMNRAIGLYDRLLSDFPKESRYRKESADNRFNLGLELQSLHRSDEAEAEFRRAADDYARFAAENPNDASSVASIGAAWNAVGDLARARNQPDRALEWYDKTLKRVPPATSRRTIVEAQAGKAQAFDQLNRHRDAIAAWDKAIQSADVNHQPALRLQRARSLVQASDHKAATREVRELASGMDQRATTLDKLARIMALAAGKADAELANEYAAECVALLRRAHEAGAYREPESAAKLNGDTDFKTMRERDVFRKFLSELGGK